MMLAILAAMALQATEPRVIWNDIREGMTASELREAHPERVPNPQKPGRNMRHAIYWGSGMTTLWNKVTIFEGCQATVEVYHPQKGPVTSVVLNGDACDQHRVFAAMVAKYGEPRETSMREDNIEMIGGGHLPRTSRDAIWFVDGRVIKLLGDDVTYEATPVASLL